MLYFYYIHKIYIELIQIIINKFKFQKNLILKFINKSFKFVFFKVIYMNIKNKILILNIPTYNDYCISFIMKFVLEDFFTSKYFFRRVRTSFEFFNNIRKWANIKWCLKGQFLNFLDILDYLLIGQYIYFYIQDIFILNLYFQFISVGYWLKKTNLLFYYYFGKKNSLGCLLIDIYLIELDKFIINFTVHFNLLFCNCKFFSKKKKIFYIRFGFVWFIGFSMFFKWILVLKKKLSFLLSNYLRLFFKKTAIKLISLRSSSIFFGGIEIKSLKSVDNVQLYCPIHKLLLNFKNLGFLKYYNNLLVPCAQRKWLSLECSDLFWRYYVLKIRLFNLYFFVTNFTTLYILKYFLKMSLIFTLGRKLKLSKKQIVFQFKSSLFKWMF